MKNKCNDEKKIHENEKWCALHVKRTFHVQNKTIHETIT